MKFTWIVLALLLAACNNQEEQKFTVDGIYLNAAGKKIMLAELPFNRQQRLVLDSATLDSTGTFNLNTLQTQEGLYQLFVENDPGILLVNDTSDIHVKINPDSMAWYRVDNSNASQSVKTLYENMRVLEKKAMVSNHELDSINKTKTADSLKVPYIRTAERNNKAVADFLMSFLRREKNGTVQWYTLGLAQPFLNREQWSDALKKAVGANSRHAGLTLMKISLAAAEADAASGRALLGKMLPDITLPDTSGKPVSVGSFKRRWLLVDFWASWCAPCRVENPGLVAISKQYHNKNFAILGISLDRDTAAWKTAIRKDSLSWPQISDLKFWESKAVEVYRFGALPFNILVDTSGKAIAVNLHGDSLKAKLAEVVR